MEFNSRRTFCRRPSYAAFVGHLQYNPLKKLAQYVMSDLITLWRVYVIYQRPTWLIMLFAFTGLLEIGMHADS